jgi:threonine aldolase
MFSIDYRSDTVTLPTPGMREAMQHALLGDDVFGEDPSINALENYAAALFGMEAGIFCPSGTMTNQIAIKCHTVPGDEVICDSNSHVYQYEGGGIAFNSGCSVNLLPGNRGRITAAQVLNAIQPDDVHRPVSRLVSLENTANRGGGSCYEWNDLVAIKEVCSQHQLGFHLDGARLFNALVAKKEKPEQYGRLFDSISICLSKGLGAPVGSILLGNKDFIKKARRIRKVFGGGMRQAGSLAAAGLYALQNNVARLEEDHRHAKLIAEALQKKSFVKEILPVETNIIVFILQPGTSPKEMVAIFEDQGILLFATGSDRLRMVVHLGISPSMVEKTLTIIESL